MITYEYPFNERVRTLLRLEDLFERAMFFLQQDDYREHHVVLLSLFEILEVAGRADLKMDLIQELERQRQALLVFRNNPEISESALSGALYEIEQASAGLQAMSGRLGQYLRENEWLMAIKSRAIIPGGVCEFDLPAYHHWQCQEPAVRREAILGWLKPLVPLREGIFIVLRLLRASSVPEVHEAKAGCFQMMLGGSSAQMVRLTLGPHLPFIPEISANKYALNVRFIRADTDQRPRQHDQSADFSFEMAFCNL